MERLPFEICRQPDFASCGPTCLHAVYRYLGDDLPLSQVIDEAHSLESGGTLDVFLACHALARGYTARIYTYNIMVFDPTWFEDPAPDIAFKLRAQAALKGDPKLGVATEGYLKFLELGGDLRFQDLTPALIRAYLGRGIPIITGLSSTFLYRSAREFGPNDDEDDVRGEPAGHFVVLSGYDAERRAVLVSDPLLPNPVSAGHDYALKVGRVIGAILLGILTYDANLLVIQKKPRRGAARA
jgi:hypothetical protein